MGALEYVPQLGIKIPDQAINIDDLAKLTDKILILKLMNRHWSS